ncbi:MAG: LuxR C-terminal-related transcriptional regulator [Treponema sp.]|nr:LuxR C-terminal-related transcriptional regulator [Treponema sp.]
METILHTRANSRVFFHFKRPRLTRLFTEAVRYPLVMVCAGAGYGKTSAILDFTEEYRGTTVWVQLSERDNVRTRFWENYTHTIAQGDTNFAREIKKLGFPDTKDKMHHYLAILRDFIGTMKRIVVVFDDFHFIEEISILRFMEQAINNLQAGASMFLISRSSVRINTAGLVSKGWLFNVSENDLRFTEDELAQYFRQLDISAQPDSLREIMQDTAGWAFAINLVAQSYQKAPGYGGYLRRAMKTNIFALMETEIWNGISEELQNFFIRLSLVYHLSFDLIELLAKGDAGLIAELERQSAYVRRDSHINAYLIHHLFLEFLAAKQETLSREQKRETYKIAGDWCARNSFMIDALSYYEKIGDYEAVNAVFLEVPAQIPMDIARYLAAMLDRAPKEAFDTVETLATLHLRAYICQGLWEKSNEIAVHYEKKILKLPENSILRKRTLGDIYLCWAILRGMLCLTDDRYDFDRYYEKFAACYSGSVEPVYVHIYSPAPWVIRVGTSAKGAPEESIKALTRAVNCVSRRFNGRMDGEIELSHGVLDFYRGHIRAAESCVTRALGRSRESKQFVLIHRELFYLMRLAVSQGDYPKIEQVLRDMKTPLDYSEYSHRYINYDILLSWYYCILGMPEKTSDWLKGNFSPYAHAGFIENFANQVKARYCYITRNYPPLLSYIQEMRQRESYLFGRLEMLAIEACVHYKMKDKAKAFAVLSEAYEAASPNDIVMPFIEMGKDMRTLTKSALKEYRGKIPEPWLENINRKSNTYAKRLAGVVTEYRQANRIADDIVFSPRETEILTDLCHGLSRADIAADRKLSPNTVKKVIANIYMKLGAKNLADLIRIALERKIV